MFLGFIWQKLSHDEKMMRRIEKERAREMKKHKFNLADDDDDGDQLTHMGMVGHLFNLSIFDLYDKIDLRFFLDLNIPILN